ncbi:MAG: hypothetical protein JO197_20525 [Acidobacteria bacterium]|nr:hypothetical protein [Acidobacteriota bacterium]MBV9474514.1 hypothetical protein [Acidobacteriota bacterium]
MNDDDRYLWDRSGTPDAETARLERVLRRYRHDKPLATKAPRNPRSRRMLWLAAAAVLICVLTAAVIAFYFRRLDWPSDGRWQVAAIDGKPRINGRVAKARDTIGVADTIATDAKSSMTVHVARIGELHVKPDSVITLDETRAGTHRIWLERGTVDARVWAPPFTFGVRTSSGLASDVGCAFQLHYDGSSGLVRVVSGWVDFDGPKRSALIPEGAQADLTASLGPGTPYYSDASREFRLALHAFDFNHDAGLLRLVLQYAKPRDAMSLLALLDQKDIRGRGEIYDRLATLTNPPEGVTREGIIAGNSAMVDTWRRSLGLGNVKRWWLQWRDALPHR